MPCRNFSKNYCHSSVKDVSGQGDGRRGLKQFIVFVRPSTRYLILCPKCIVPVNVGAQLLNVGTHFTLKFALQQSSLR